MTRVLRDPRSGVTHKFEAAARHNTRCGQRVGVPWTPIGGRDGATLPEGVVDCMACLAGRSHLSVMDLRDGVEVKAWIRLDDGARLVGSAKPITFTRGTNIDVVIFDDLPVGVVARGYSYFDEDGRCLYSVEAFPRGLVRGSEDNTVMIYAGEARVR